jgi:hypothetical protein
LATKDPEQYCNGTFLYSTKDPGDGKEFVVTDTNEPVLKAELILKSAGAIHLQHYGNTKKKQIRFKHPSRKSNL